MIRLHGKEKLEAFHEHLSTIHPGLKINPGLIQAFTKELEEEGCLPYLDVLVQRKMDGSLGHSVYRKKTHTDRYLNSKSHHHPQQKASVIKTLTHRAKIVCDTEHIQSEMRHLMWALKGNGYSVSFIKRAMKERYLLQDDDRKGKKPLAYAKLPYISGVTDRIARILQKGNIKTRFCTVKKIKNVLPSPKDSHPPLQSMGVYEVPCCCGRSYVGQSKRSISQRLKEHERAMKLHQWDASAVAEHYASSPGHKIMFNATRVLAKTEEYHPRLIREAIEIAKRPNNFNREDGYNLSRIWRGFLAQSNDQRLSPPVKIQIGTTMG